MARTWPELFLTGDAPAGPPSVAPDGEPGSEGEPRGRFFRRLRDNLRKSREALGAELEASVFQRLDEEAWERLEETLIYADVGAQTTASIVERLEREAGAGELTGGDDLSRRLRELLAEAARVGDDHIDLRRAADGDPLRGGQRHRQDDDDRQGRLAPARTSSDGRCWSPRATPSAPPRSSSSRSGPTRSGADIVRAAPGSDPGAVAYDAVEAARARGHDVVLVDTAGRLHTQDNLMQELAKVSRVIEKQLPGAPHETLLTIDATTGQNGLRQAQLFRESVQVDGIILTKLDGTAKGGIALAIAQEPGVPVKLIGIGEAIEDLRPFDPDDFASALLGE